MELYIENCQDKLPVTTDLQDNLKAALDVASKIHGLADYEMSIILVDNDKIQQINREYRDKDQATDVISFALNDGGAVAEWEEHELGDVYISLERAREQAEEYGHSFMREVCYLAVHGLLHLLGLDHMTAEDKEEMRSKEEEIMQSIGLTRNKAGE